MRISSIRPLLCCWFALATLLVTTSLAHALDTPLTADPDAEHEALVATPNASTGSCGVERWSVKTGTDADAGSVNTTPVSQTISYLRGLTAPSTLPANNRVAPTELTTFVLDATLVEYKLENDSDYHLVLADAQGNTMIAEIPDPACVGSGSPFAGAIQHARQEFDATYTATTSFQSANVPVQVTGVGFFDFNHGQTGVAPNAIELHPVLDIVFNPTTGGNPDFGLSAAPANVSVNQGASATTTISVAPQNGFSGNVSFAASGLPAGVTAAFNPTSSASSSTLTLSAGSLATTGTATVTITGTSGSLSHSTTLSLTVNASGGGGGGGAQTALYDANLKAPSCASTGTSCDSGTLLVGRGNISGGAEPNQPNTLGNSCADGNSGTFHSDESDDRIVIASTDGGPLTAGKTAKVTATVWAYSTADALDLYSAADATNPNWTFLNTIAPSASGQQTLSTTFTLPAGGLQAVRAHFRYQGSAAPCSTGSYDESDDLAFAVAAATQAPDFALSAAPALLSVNQGANGTSTVTVGSLNGFSAATALAVAGLPNGVTAAFSANPVTPAAGGSANSTLTFSASTTATTGSGTVTITGTAGSLSHTTSVNLTVAASGGGGVVQLLGNPGFESGAATPWSMSSGTLCSNSSCTGEVAHSGSWFAWLDGYGTTHTDTLAQTVTIPAGKTSATLTFWLHVDTAETSTTTAYDTLTVQLLNGSGTVLTTLATYSNLDAITGYAQHSLDVSAYIGQTVTLKFTGTEDASNQTSFVLDDLNLNVQ